jgi:hypothetical protein
VLLAWIQFGTAQVAAGTWAVLPPVASFALVGAILVAAVGLAVAGSRAVRREIERADG